MTQTPQSFRPAYILVVSDEGASREIGCGPDGPVSVYDASNARFRKEYLEVDPNLKKLAEEGKLVFFSDVDVARDYVAARLHKGEKPSALFLDVEVQGHHCGGECTVRIIRDLEKAGAKTPGRRSDISIYVISKRWDDFLKKTDPEPKQLLAMADLRTLNLGYPGQLTNRLLSEASWLDSRNMHVGGTGRRIALVTKNEGWMETMRGNIMHFDRFVRIYSNSEELLEGLATMTEKSRTVTSIHFGQDMDLARFFQHFETPEGMKLMQDYAKVQADREIKGNGRVENYGIRTRPSTYPAVYVYSEAFFAPENRIDQGRERLSPVELKELYGVTTPWLVLPVRPGQFESIRTEVQAIWLPKLDEYRHNGMAPEASWTAEEERRHRDVGFNGPYSNGR